MTTTETRTVLPDGTEVQITARAAHPATERFELEMVVPPHSTATPPHVHPDQTDEFQVVEGSLEVLMGTEWRRVGVGERLVVPPGVVHTYRNHGEQRAVVHNVHNPAGSFQAYIDRLGMLSKSGKLENFKSPKALVHLSVLWGEHTDSMRFADAKLRALTGVLATVGKVLRVRVPQAP